MRRPLWCVRCRQDRDRSAFTWGARRRAAYCRECQSAVHSEWRRTPAGKNSESAAARRAKERYPDKVKARNALYQEIRMGRMVKGDCESALTGECRGRVEAHHDDYSRPLDVRWLCQHHHRSVDQEKPGASAPHQKCETLPSATGIASTATQSTTDFTTWGHA